MKKLLLILLFCMVASVCDATVVYVDLAGGDDSTGDGTYGNPYLTIEKGDDGLTDGDEVRVAKTTMATLSGTLTFTENSTSVTTSADQTGVVSAGDVIGKNETGEGWWLVSSVSSGAITLSCAYWGSAETTTGYAMSSATGTNQTSTSDGSGTSNRLKITGGWDLSTQTRDGYTYFQNTAATYGYRVYGAYSEVSYFVFSTTNTSYAVLRIEDYYIYVHHCHIAGGTNTGRFLGSYNFLIIEDMTNTGYNSAEQYTFSDVDGISVYRAYAFGGADSSFYLNDTGYVYFEDCVAKGNTAAAWYVQDGVVTSIQNATVSNCGYGVRHYLYGSNTYVNSPSISNCTHAFYSDINSNTIFVYNPTLSSNTNDYTDSGGDNHNPQIKVYDSAGNHKAYLSHGEIESDTSDARSGTCMKISPGSTDNERLTRVELGSYKVTSTASDLTVSAYMKDDSSFNGTVRLFARQGFEVVVQPTTKTMTTSYVKQELTVSSGDLTVGEYVHLVALIAGTAGSVYVDDFEVSQ